MLKRTIWAVQLPKRTATGFIREHTYKVERTQNTRKPAIGDVLAGEEIDNFIAAGVVVNIKVVSK